MMCGTCTISDWVRGRGSSWTWWTTTFVTRHCWFHLLVPSPTYFEIIIYDLVGLTKLVACHLWGSVLKLLWSTIWPCGVEKICCLPFVGSVSDLLWNTCKSIECPTQSVYLVVGDCDEITRSIKQKYDESKLVESPKLQVPFLGSQIIMPSHLPLFPICLCVAWKLPSL